MVELLSVVCMRSPLCSMGSIGSRITVRESRVKELKGLKGMGLSGFGLVGGMD